MRGRLRLKGGMRCREDLHKQQRIQSAANQPCSVCVGVDWRLGHCKGNLGCCQVAEAMGCASYSNCKALHASLAQVGGGEGAVHGQLRLKGGIRCREDAMGCTMDVVAWIWMCTVHIVQAL